LARLLFIPARLLLLMASPLQRLLRIPAGLLLVLAAGPFLRRPGVLAELPPLIPMRGTADMLQPLFVTADIS
jgi:hypothetical protein